MAEAQAAFGRTCRCRRAIRWNGRANSARCIDAKKRLALIVPLSLLLILMLLYSLFNSVRRQPACAVAAFRSRWRAESSGSMSAGLNFSVSAAVGFISLFGVSAMDGILLVSYIRRDLEEGMGTEDAIIHAAEAQDAADLHDGASRRVSVWSRRRISTGIGSQVQQPLACVIVGGMLLSPICSLLVIPVLARLWMPTIKDTGMHEVVAP